jgi:folate-dependent phosphoribosylglycinamide formyltransferase PurN
MFRVVLLTDGNPHGIRILEGLRKRGVMVHAVVHQGDGPWRQSGTSLGRFGDLARSPVRIIRRVKRRYKTKQLYQSFSDRIVITGDLNSARMCDDLISVSPDFIILGGTGILKESIIKTARIGVINVHPGLLPWVRNVGVVGSALQRNIAVGATCHYVNTGIDTGNIIERRLLAVTGEEASLSDIELKTHILMAQMMVEIVAGQVAVGQIPKATPQTSEYPLCRWLSADERRLMDQEIAQGKAKWLLDLWSTSLADKYELMLPPNFEAPGVESSFTRGAFSLGEAGK